MEVILDLIPLHLMVSAVTQCLENIKKELGSRRTDKIETICWAKILLGDYKQKISEVCILVN